MRPIKPRLPIIPLKSARPKKGHRIIRSEAEERRLRAIAKARRAALLRNNEEIELENE
jgi:hypothetical protein